MILLMLACSFEGLTDQTAIEALETNNMVSISGTTYAMGYPDTDPGPYGNHWKETAQPQHTVVISAFELDRYEVTVQEYADFLTSLYSQHPEAARPHHHPP